MFEAGRIPFDFTVRYSYHSVMSPRTLRIVWWTLFLGSIACFILSACTSKVLFCSFGGRLELGVGRGVFVVEIKDRPARAGLHFEREDDFYWIPWISRRPQYLIPLWTPILLLLMAYYFLPKSKRILGTCSRCGYDLRGLTERRCPECFTPFD